jgi:hypothetical protein
VSVGRYRSDRVVDKAWSDGFVFLWRRGCIRRHYFVTLRFNAMQGDRIGRNQQSTVKLTLKTKSIINQIC